MDGRVLDVLSFRIADEMPVDRIAGKSHILAHAIELDAIHEHLACAHRHHVPAEEGLFRVGRRLKFDIACQQADFAALIHVEGDLAEVHVVELLVERDRVAADGGNRAPLGLPRIEVRRRQHNLVARAPTSRVQDLYRGAARIGRIGELSPRILAVAVQVQRPAHQHDPPVAPVPAAVNAIIVTAYDVFCITRVSFASTTRSSTGSRL